MQLNRDRIFEATMFIRCIHGHLKSSRPVDSTFTIVVTYYFMISFHAVLILPLVALCMLVLFQIFLRLNLQSNCCLEMQGRDPAAVIFPVIKHYQVGRGSTTVLWLRNNLESQLTVMPSILALKAAQAVNFILVHGFMSIVKSWLRSLIR